MTTQTTIDLGALSRAIEERDASSQLALYADDAEVRIVDRNHPPRSPQVLRGKDAIREWIEDVCSRDMTHQVNDTVGGQSRIAFTEDCTYPDGTKVLCSASADVSDGRIARQLVVQVWDD
jgi:ketosteroid isomerase-like protein